MNATTAMNLSRVIIRAEEEDDGIDTATADGVNFLESIGTRGPEILPGVDGAAAAIIAILLGLAFLVSAVTFFSGLFFVALPGDNNSSKGVGLMKNGGAIFLFIVLLPLVILFFVGVLQALTS